MRVHRIIRIFGLLVVGLLQGVSAAMALDLPIEVQDAIRARDFERAVDLLGPLSEGGNAEAHYQLASLYRLGQGVRKDDKAAFVHMKAAAELGLPEAQYGLSLLYERGRGTPRNSVLALDWLKEAAAAGEEQARVRLHSFEAEEKNLGSAGVRDRVPFCTAVRRAKARDVKDMIASAPGLASTTCDGDPAIFAALATGDLTLLNGLLEADASPNAVDSKGRTALLASAAMGHDLVAARLAELTSRPDAVDGNGYTALHYAAARGLETTTTRLLARGVAVNRKTNKGQTALDIALGRSNTAVIAILKMAGAKKGLQAAFAAKGTGSTGDGAAPSGFFAGWPTLHVLAWKGETQSLSAVIANGADVGLKDEEGYTGLGRAILAEQRDAVQVLVKANTPLSTDLSNDKGEVALACQSNDVALRDLVFESVAAQGLTLQHPASSIESLLSRNEGEAAFFILSHAEAYRSSETAMAQAVLAAGLEPLSLLQHLIVYGGGDVNFSIHGESPLSRAVAANRMDNVLWLIDKGADVRQRSAAGLSPLDDAALVNDAAMVRLLIAHGASPNDVSGNGNSALHLAAGRGGPEAVSALLAAGAEINQKNERGNTPLAIAALASNSETARTLMEAGANPLIPNAQGKRPEDLVPDSQSNLVRLIRAHRKSRHWLFDSL